MEESLLETGCWRQQPWNRFKFQFWLKVHEPKFIRSLSIFSILFKNGKSLSRHNIGRVKAEKFSILINNINNNIACLHERSLCMYMSLLEW